MNAYEVLVMLDPEAPEERHEEIIARARELVERGGGSWVAHEPWGRRKLAYEIGHRTDGVYHLLQFDAEPATLDEISRVLKITDGVMRHLATRRPKGGGRTGPPPLPAADGARGREAARPGEPAAAAAGAAADAAAAEEYAESSQSEPASEEEGA